jgi:DNA-directed RNA polymerase subunit L
MKRFIICAIVALTLLSCRKETLDHVRPIAMEGPTVFHHAYTNGIVFNGNSQLDRWEYYNWAKSWDSLPIDNAARGGTTWNSMYARIGDSITAKSPKVIVLYQGENEYNGYNKRADVINTEYIRFFDEVRRQNPSAHILVLSMLKIPKLVYKGLGSDVDKLNNYYRAKTQTDNNASYLDINPGYPSTFPSALWRPDSIHLNTYVPFLSILKPVLTDLYFEKDSVITDSIPKDTIKRRTMFFGSSTPAQIDLKLFPDSVNMIKAGYGGRTWYMLQALTDTIKRAGITHVFLYSGANDILAKRSVSQMTVDIQNLMRKIWTENPNIHITYVTTHPSDTAFKIKLKDGVTTGIQATEYVNRNITNWIANYHAQHASVVNSYGTFLLWNPKRVNTTYFNADKLHLNRSQGQPKLVSLMLTQIK